MPARRVVENQLRSSYYANEMQIFPTEPPPTVFTAEERPQILPKTDKSKMTMAQVVASSTSAPSPSSTSQVENENPKPRPKLVLSINKSKSKSPPPASSSEKTAPVAAPSAPDADSGRKVPALEAQLNAAKSLASMNPDVRLSRSAVKKATQPTVPTPEPAPAPTPAPATEPEQEPITTHDKKKRGRPAKAKTQAKPVEPTSTASVTVAFRNTMPSLPITAPADDEDVAMEQAAGPRATQDPSNLVPPVTIKPRKAGNRSTRSSGNPPAGPTFVKATYAGLRPPITSTDSSIAEAKALMDPSFSNPANCLRFDLPPAVECEEVVKSRERNERVIVALVRNFVDKDVAMTGRIISSMNLEEGIARMESNCHFFDDLFDSQALKDQYRLQMNQLAKLDEKNKLQPGEYGWIYQTFLNQCVKELEVFNRRVLERILDHYLSRLKSVSEAAPTLALYNLFYDASLAGYFSPLYPHTAFRARIDTVEKISITGKLEKIDKTVVFGPENAPKKYLAMVNEIYRKFNKMPLTNSPPTTEDVNEKRVEWFCTNTSPLGFIEPDYGPEEVFPPPADRDEKPNEFGPYHILFEKNLKIFLEKNAETPALAKKALNFWNTYWNERPWKAEKYMKYIENAKVERRSLISRHRYILDKLRTLQYLREQMFPNINIDRVPDAPADLTDADIVQKMLSESAEFKELQKRQLKEFGTVDNDLALIRGIKKVAKIKPPTDAEHRRRAKQVDDIVEEKTSMRYNDTERQALNVHKTSEHNVDELMKMPDEQIAEISAKKIEAERKECIQAVEDDTRTVTAHMRAWGLKNKDLPVEGPFGPEASVQYMDRQKDERHRFREELVGEPTEEQVKATRAVMEGLIARKKIDAFLHPLEPVAPLDAPIQAWANYETQPSEEDATRNEEDLDAASTLAGLWNAEWPAGRPTLELNTNLPVTHSGKGKGMLMTPDSMAPVFDDGELENELMELTPEPEEETKTKSGRKIKKAVSQAKKTTGKNTKAAPKDKTSGKEKAAPKEKASKTAPTKKQVPEKTPAPVPSDRAARARKRNAAEAGIETTTETEGSLTKSKRTRVTPQPLSTSSSKSSSPTPRTPNTSTRRTDKELVFIWKYDSYTAVNLSPLQAPPTPPGTVKPDILSMFSKTPQFTDCDEEMARYLADKAQLEADLLLGVSMAVPAGAPAAPVVAPVVATVMAAGAPTAPASQAADTQAAGTDAPADATTGRPKRTTKKTTVAATVARTKVTKTAPRDASDPKNATTSKAKGKAPALKKTDTKLANKLADALGIPEIEPTKKRSKSPSKKTATEPVPDATTVPARPTRTSSRKATTGSEVVQSALTAPIPAEEAAPAQKKRPLFFSSEVRAREASRESSENESSPKKAAGPKKTEKTEVGKKPKKDTGKNNSTKATDTIKDNIATLAPPAPVLAPTPATTLPPPPTGRITRKRPRQEEEPQQNPTVPTEPPSKRHAKELSPSNQLLREATATPTKKPAPVKKAQPARTTRSTSPIKKAVVPAKTTKSKAVRKELVAKAMLSKAAESRRGVEEREEKANTMDVDVPKKEQDENIPPNVVAGVKRLSVVEDTTATRRPTRARKPTEKGAEFQAKSKRH